MTKTNKPLSFSSALYTSILPSLLGNVTTAICIFCYLFVCLFDFIWLPRWLFILEDNYLTKLLHGLYNIIKNWIIR